MDQYQLYEAYLSGQLSEQESKDFELRLESDADFKDDFEEHRNIQDALSLFVEEDVKQVIDGLKSSHHQHEKKRAFRWWPLLILFVLGLTALGIYKMQSKVESPNSMYAAYYDPFFSTIERSGNTEGQPADVYELYGKEINGLVEQGDWKEASQKLQSMLSKVQGQTKDLVEWNLAVVTAEFDNEKAQQLLNDILSNPNHDYANESETKQLLTSLQE